LTYIRSKACFTADPQVQTPRAQEEKEEEADIKCLTRVEGISDDLVLKFFERIDRIQQAYRSGKIHGAAAFKEWIQKGQACGKAGD
jgi:hypothetical protein